MIYTLKGQVIKKDIDFFVLEQSGIGFKVLTTNRTLTKLPALGSEINIFCFLYSREDRLELYGFLEEETLKLFKMFISVTGIGPKTAIAILGINTTEKLMAAIIEKRSEFLTHASGIGRKTADRIILELHSKIKLPSAKTLTKVMDLNMEVEEALVSLGYKRSYIQEALNGLDSKLKTLEERLRAALKVLSNL